MIQRRHLLGATVPLLSSPAIAQTRSLRAIVPFPPGGGVDVFARILAPALGAALGQAVVVENIGGASSRIGTQAVLRAAPDGQTILITNDTLAAIEALPIAGAGPFLPGLAPVLLGAAAPQLLITHPRSGFASAADYAARLRGPRPVHVGVPGLGSSQHFASELIGQALGGRPEHVVYRGGGPLLTDLLAGTVDAGVVTLGAGIEHLRDGRLIGLAVTSPQRAAAAPAIPALAEALAPGFAVETWMGVLAPGGTPPATLAKLYAASLAALRTQTVGERLAALGFEAPGLPPEPFGIVLRDTAGRFRAIAQSLGLRAGEA